MTRLSPGTQLPALELHPAIGDPLTLPLPGQRWVHLQFRRFAGCPICNLHLHALAQRAADLEQAGIRSLAVFHSPQEDLAPYQADLPFTLIADPERILFKRFGVESSLGAVLHPQAMEAGIRGLLAHGVALRFNDNRLGLPADFLITTDGRIHAAKYGTHADDQWTADELLALVAEA